MFARTFANQARLVVTKSISKWNSMMTVRMKGKEMSCFKSVKAAAAAVVLGFVAVGSAEATVINLNLGESSAVQETIAGEVWNNLTTSAAPGTIQDSTGANTSLSVTVSAISANPSDGNGAGYTGAANDSMTTSLFFGNGTHTVTLSGLDDGDTYEVTMWAGLNNVNLNMALSVIGSNEGTQVANNAAAFASNTTFSFTGTVSGGSIISTAAPTLGDTNGGWQGISINITPAVPEPSTAMLAGLGVAVLVTRRRRRRR
ncbi:MAG: PEP-CTERM sorting domain-containing protein [Pirellulales bacterium]|nr:PEP-CTERM sorting domain-containing protein [Pirellulales bacterium]